MKNLITGSINFAALKHVLMEKKGKSGNMVKGIFIPIDANLIQEHESGGKYLNIVAFEMEEAKEWATHIVKQSFKKEVREKMTEEEKKAVPILGNLKTGPFTPPADVNDAGEGETYDADGSDDLPF